MNVKNFRMGDIHKLITLDTPHKGSFLADLAINLPANKRNDAIFWFNFIKKPINRGAIDDLATTSVAIGTMNSSPVQLTPCHVIVGDYRIPLNNYLLIQDAKLSVLYNVYLLARLGLNLDPYVINGHSDLIVSTTSQQGGINTQYVETYGHLHTDISSIEIFQELCALLNSSADDNIVFSQNGFN